MRPVTPKPENLASLIFFVRGEKVLLDADLSGTPLAAVLRQLG